MGRDAGVAVHRIRELREILPVPRSLGEGGWLISAAVIPRRRAPEAPLPVSFSRREPLAGAPDALRRGSFGRANPTDIAFQHILRGQALPAVVRRRKAGSVPRSIARKHTKRHENLAEKNIFSNISGSELSMFTHVFDCAFECSQAD